MKGKWSCFRRSKGTIKKSKVGKRECRNLRIGIIDTCLTALIFFFKEKLYKFIWNIFLSKVFPECSAHTKIHKKVISWVQLFRHWQTCRSLGPSVCLATALAGSCFSGDAEYNSNVAMEAYTSMTEDSTRQPAYQRLWGQSLNGRTIGCWIASNVEHLPTKTSSKDRGCVGFKWRSY